MLSQTKKLYNTYGKDLFLVAIIILVALISFGLGRLSKIREQKVPITIKNMSASANLATQPQLPSNLEARLPSERLAKGGELVASKNGTKYHFPWCSGAKRIKDSNKIRFASVEEARKAGYTPASNCKGLE